MSENIPIVKYHNDLNAVVMRRWTAEEMNFFIGLLAILKEKGIQTHTFDRDELRRLIKFRQTNRERFDTVIEGAVKNLASIYYYEKTDIELKVMPLFSKFVYNYESNKLVVKLNDEYQYILNQLTKNFTLFELDEYLKLSSTYSKSMYRLLKQWRTLGKKEFDKEQLYLLLDVPESTQNSSNFNSRVLKPIIKELSQVFSGLKVEPVRGRGRGNPVISYIFTWKPEIPPKKKEYPYKSYGKKNLVYQEPIPYWLKKQMETEKQNPVISEPESVEFFDEDEIKKRIQELLNQ